MSLFTKTVYVRGGLSGADARALEGIFDHLGKVLKERFEGLDAEVKELREEVARLKAAPRMTVAQRARARGHV